MSLQESIYADFTLPETMFSAITESIYIEGFISDYYPIETYLYSIPHLPAETPPRDFFMKYLERNEGYQTHALLKDKGLKSSEWLPPSLLLSFVFSMHRPEEVQEFFNTVINSELQSEHKVFIRQRHLMLQMNWKTSGTFLKAAKQLSTPEGFAKAVAYNINWLRKHDCLGDRISKNQTKHYFLDDLVIPIYQRVQLYFFLTQIGEWLELEKKFEINVPMHNSAATYLQINRWSEVHGCYNRRLHNFVELLMFFDITSIYFDYPWNRDKIFTEDNMQLKHIYKTMVAKPEPLIEEVDNYWDKPSSVKKKRKRTMVPL